MQLYVKCDLRIFKLVYLKYSSWNHEKNKNILMYFTAYLNVYLLLIILSNWVHNSLFTKKNINSNINYSYYFSILQLKYYLKVFFTTLKMYYKYIPKHKHLLNSKLNFILNSFYCTYTFIVNDTFVIIYSTILTNILTLA